MALLLGNASQNQIPLLLRNSNSIYLISQSVNSGNNNSNHRVLKDYRKSGVLAILYCAFKIAILLWINFVLKWFQLFYTGYPLWRHMQTVQTQIRRPRIWSNLKGLHYLLNAASYQGLRFLLTGIAWYKWNVRAVTNCAISYCQIRSVHLKIR